MPLPKWLTGLLSHIVDTEKETIIFFLPIRIIDNEDFEIRGDLVINVPLELSNLHHGCIKSSDQEYHEEMQFRDWVNQEIIRQQEIFKKSGLKLEPLYPEGDHWITCFSGQLNPVHGTAEQLCDQISQQGFIPKIH